MNKQLIAFFEDRSEDINKEEAYVLIPFIVEKIGDGKFADPLYKIVSTMCRKIPGKYLIGHIVKYIKGTEGKKPKLNSDACTLLSKIV